MVTYLFTFTKKENSTKRPSTSSGKKLNCHIKSQSSTTSAHLEFQTIENPTTYNYVYIPDFKTYYYIENWTYDRNIWTANCTNDVLATYKTEIGNAELYVLRSASSYDNDLIDNFYPIKPSHTLKRTSATMTNWTTDLSQGNVVCRLWSSGADWSNLNTIVFEPTQFTHLMNALYPEDNRINVTIYDVLGQAIGDGLNSLMYNPTQYIQSIKWFPFSVAKGTTSYKTMFGTWLAQWNNRDPNYSQRIDTSGNRQSGTGWYDVIHYKLGNPIKTYNLQLQIPKRDTATKRGNWTEQEPFAEYYFYNKFWGTIKLNSNILAYSLGAINLKIDVDCISGQATLVASAVDSDGVHSNILFSQTRSIAVDIETDDTKKRSDEGNRLNIVADSLGNLATGNYPGLGGDMLGLIGSFVSSNGPDTKSNIGYATLSTLDNEYTIYGIFYDLAEENIALNGRPLRKKKKINTLSGYTLVQNGDIAIAGTREEQSRIKSYLEGGFYYE